MASKLMSLFGGTKSPEDAQLVANLAAETNLSAVEIEKLRAKFVLCADPNSHNLDKHGFRLTLRSYFKQDNIKWDGFFRVFDADHTGNISFSEFVRSLSILLIGPENSKLDMLFRVFDEDGDGTLGPSDVANLTLFLERSAGEWPLPDTKGKQTVAQLLKHSPQGDSISKETFLRYGLELSIIESLILPNEKLSARLLSVIAAPTAMKFVSTRWNSYNYDKVQHFINTGDLLLYHGREFFSRAIELTTRSCFSHAAVLVRDPPEDIRTLYKLAPSDHLFVFESDTITLDGRAGGGVQLTEFRHWLVSCAEEYKMDGLGVIRRLHIPNRDLKNDWGPSGTFPKFASFMKTVQGRGYETRRVQLLGAIAGYNKADDLSTIFCSELVAAAYKEMDIIHPSVLPCNVSPAAFSSTHTSKPNSVLSFLRDATFDREVVITVNS